jgi:hypothetical protein
MSTASAFAGDKELFDAAAHPLSVMGKASFFLGEVGAGANMKLVRQSCHVLHKRESLRSFHSFKEPKEREMQGMRVRRSRAGISAH